MLSVSIIFTKQVNAVDEKLLNNTALHVHTYDLWDVTGRMGARSVSCDQTQVNTPNLIPGT